MIRKKKIIFVHGYGVGAPLELGDWPDLLAKEFCRYGFDFNLLAMPNPILPEVNSWLNFLNEQNLEIDSDTYFIGHSLGCITIARYLEKLPKNKVVGGCVFVAGFSSLSPSVPILSSFCNLPLDFSLVKKHSKEFVVVLSDNDHIVPPSASKELGNQLGARVIVEHNKGHFLDNIKEVPSVLNVILEIDLAKQKLRLE